VRFFLLAVFATMYVRDHMRPEFHKALGVDIDEYDFRVFRLTTEISKQVFPVTLDIDDPRFRTGLRRLLWVSDEMTAAKQRGGIVGTLQRAGLAAIGAATFARLYLLPVRSHELPARIRLAPVW